MLSIRRLAFCVLSTIFATFAAAEITFNFISFEKKLMPDPDGLYRLEADGAEYNLIEIDGELFKKEENTSHVNQVFSDQLELDRLYKEFLYYLFRSRESTNSKPVNGHEQKVYAKNNFNYVYLNYDHLNKSCLVSKGDRLKDLCNGFNKVFFEESEAEEEDNRNIDSSVKLIGDILQAKNMVVPKISQDRLQQLLTLIDEMSNIEEHKFKYRIPSICSSLKSLELNLRYRFKDDLTKRMFVYEHASYIQIEVDVFIFKVPKADLNKGEIISKGELKYRPDPELSDPVSIFFLNRYPSERKPMDGTMIFIRISAENEIEYLESERVEEFLSCYFPFRGFRYSLE